MKNGKYKITIAYSIVARSREVAERIAETDIQDRRTFINASSKIESIVMTLDRPLLGCSYLVKFSYVIVAESESKAWEYAERDASYRAETHDDYADVFEVEFLEGVAV
jgi:hypothetical protein